MNPKLYVGNIPYKTTDADLKDHFSKAGNVVSSAVIVDKRTGRSKGFGFVEMSTAEEAQKAIELFNKQDFGGRSIIVNEARPKKEIVTQETTQETTQEPTEETTEESTQEPAQESTPAAE